MRTAKKLTLSFFEESPIHWSETYELFFCRVLIYKNRKEKIAQLYF